MRISAISSAPIVLSVAVIASTMATSLLPALSLPTHADNSQMNAGDQSKYALTAQNQDNKHGDVKKLGKIRRHIMGTKGLSMDARNVKIIVSKGEVTLKGPVKDEAEKTKVEEVVKACCPEVAVVSQLTVLEK